mgnify:CR=1 FL=1
MCSSDLGSPAAIPNAINDALSPLNASIETLPMSQEALFRAISAAGAVRR